jgi:hypothetical protein
MELPKSSFSSIAEEAKLCLILNNKLYTAKAREEKSNNFFYFANKKYLLQESESVRCIERVYLKNNEIEFKSIINNISKKSLKEDNNLLKKDIFELQKKYELLDFIVNKVFPIYSKNKNNIKLKSKNPKPNQKLEKILKPKIDKHKFENLKDGFECLLNRDYSILERNIIKNINLLIFNGSIYITRKIPEKIYKTIRNRFRINNTSYSYKFTGYLKDLEKEYLKNLSDEITKFSNHNGNLLNEKINLLSKKNNFSEIVKKQIYQEGSTGFIKKGQDYYIFLEQEPFALKSLNQSDYYVFEKCKVGVKLKLNNHKIEIGSSVVIDKYSHPLLPGFDISEQRICTGNGINSNVMNNFNEKKDDVGKALYILKIGEFALRNGYCSGMTPHHHLNINTFHNNLTTRKEINKRGIIVEKQG